MMHSVECNSILMFEYMILDLKCLLRAMVVYTYSVHSTPGIYWSIVEHHDRTSLLPAMRTNYYCLTRNRKARARKKKDKCKKQKAPGIMPTTNPWREKEWAGKTKKTNFFPSSFFFLNFLLLLFSFFGFAVSKGLLANDDANDAQHKTTHNSGPCPFLPFLTPTFL